MASAIITQPQHRALRAMLNGTLESGRSGAGWRTKRGTRVTSAVVDEFARRGLICFLSGARFVRLSASGVRLAKILAQICERCGCTEERACDGGCAWIAPDLCSACGETPKAVRRK